MGIRADGRLNHVGLSGQTELPRAPLGRTGRVAHTEQRRVVRKHVDDRVAVGEHERDRVDAGVHLELERAPVAQAHEDQSPSILDHHDSGHRVRVRLDELGSIVGDGSSERDLDGEVGRGRGKQTKHALGDLVSNTVDLVDGSPAGGEIHDDGRALWRDRRSTRRKPREIDGGTNRSVPDLKLSPRGREPVPARHHAHVERR